MLKSLYILNRNQFFSSRKDFWVQLTKSFSFAKELIVLLVTLIKRPRTQQNHIPCAQQDRLSLHSKQAREACIQMLKLQVRDWDLAYS